MYNEPNKGINRLELDSLFAHIVRCPVVLQTAASKLELSDFDEQYESGHKLIWAILKDFYKEHRRAPPANIMYAEIEKRGRDAPQFQDKQILFGVQQLAYDLYTKPEDKDLIPDVAITILQSFLWQRRLNATALSKVETHGEFNQSMLAELNTISKAIAVNRGTAFTPFGPGVSLLGATPRDPIGVPFVDLLLNGGAISGELYGLIAPSSGGKTTLSNQVALSYAERGRKVLVFSYEQELSNDYFVPIYACAADIERTKIEKIPLGCEDLSPYLSVEEIKRLDEAKKRLGSNIVFVDFSGTKDRAGFGGAEEIEATINTYIASGFKPDAIIIDWFWIMVARRYNTLKLDYGKSKDMRPFATEVIDALRVIAGINKLWVWVNQQLTSADASKKKAAEHNQAAEFKGFSHLMNICFTINAADEQGICTLNASKARNVAKGKQIIKLEGLMARFVSKSSNMAVDRHTHKYTDKNEMNKVPTETQRKSSNQIDYEGRSEVTSVNM